MPNVWKWKVQAVVVLAYGVLFVLYFIDGQLERCPTIISLQSRSPQLLLISTGPKAFMLYDTRGHREEVDKSRLGATNSWLMDLLNRELSKGEDVELRVDASRHMLMCQVLRDGRYFVFLYGASLELESSGPAAWHSLADLDEKLAGSPAGMEEGSVGEAKRMACAYFGST